MDGLLEPVTETSEHASILTFSATTEYEISEWGLAAKAPNKARLQPLLHTACWASSISKLIGPIAPVGPRETKAEYFLALRRGLNVLKVGEVLAGSSKFFCP